MATAQRSTKELRELPEAELIPQLDALRNELWHARVKASERALQQTHRLRELRRQIARVTTILKGRR